VLETTEAEQVATGFIFTEGPTWHPDGYWYFVDLRQNTLPNCGAVMANSSRRTRFVEYQGGL
jgi:sugar lactone lactonase YvrE